jgi:hypothetical protein
MGNELKFFQSLQFLWGYIQFFYDMLHDMALASTIPLSKAFRTKDGVSAFLDFRFRECCEAIFAKVMTAFREG